MKNVAIWITHAPHGAGRQDALQKTLDSLHREQVPSTSIYIRRDKNREGSLACFLAAMKSALGEAERVGGVTHILRLADDTPVHPGFGLLCTWLSRLDLSVAGPIDLVVNTDHPDVQTQAAAHEGPGLYVSADGGCTGATLWPIPLLKSYLAWRERWLPDDVADDRGVNLWSIAQAIPVYKTVRSLVSHLTDVPSVDGNDGDAHRVPLYPMTAESARVWAAFGSSAVKCIRIGRTYSNIQRELFYRRKGFWHARAVAALDDATLAMRRAGADIADALPIVHAKMNLDERVHAHPESASEPYLTPEIIERAYAVERHGAPLDPKGVAICCPAQRGLHAEVSIAMHATEAAMRDAGFRVSYILTSGHSLVTRARHRLQHLFMTSDCSWMLSWDDDVVPLDPSVVVRMLKKERDILAGAYPLRGNADAVAANPLRRGDGAPILKVEPDGTASVRDAATGFLLVKRRVFADLMARHPERFYLDRGQGFMHAPMWDLFSTFVDPGEPMGSDGARSDPNAEFWPTYRSEDYGFCTLARQAGYDVRIMMDARFDHHGVGVYRGSAAEAWLPKAKPIA